MKKYILIAVGLLAINFAEAKSNDSPKRVSHSTYSVPGRFNSDNITHKNNYKDFDFVYVMALPKWKAEDFDLTQSEINKKYIDEFDYKNLSASSKGRGMAQVPELIENIHKTECKILCSFPGQDYDVIARDPKRRVKFARMMASFCKKHNYDGIELDWEGTVTEPLHLAFVKDIRKALDDLNSPKRLYLTTALNTGHKYSKELADQLSATVDWINIMSYDMGGGPWTKRGVVSYNTSLKTLKERMAKNWSVFAPEKICIGLANYGYGYNNSSPDTPLKEGDIDDNFCFTVMYNELDDYISKGWVEKWSDEHQSSYFFSPDGKSFFSMDTPRAIQAKLDWVYQEGYHGVFWWEYHMDIKQSTKDDKRAQHLLIDGAADNINKHNKRVKNE